MTKANFGEFKMEINQLKQVKVNAKTLKVHVKVTDRFGGELVDQDGITIFKFDDTYVPDFFPGDHYGDYLILDIDIDTGMITNWVKPTALQIEEAIKED
jgi:hypothetical protein